MRTIAFSALAILGSFSAACSGTPDAGAPIDAASNDLSVASDAYALPMLTTVSLGPTARPVGNVTVQDARNSGGAVFADAWSWVSAIRGATASGAAPSLAPNAERLVASPGATSAGALGASGGLWSDAPVSTSVGFRGNRPTVASWKTATTEEAAAQQDRGARLACAFREAASRMNGARVAQAPWSAARLDFFGYPVEVMQVAPTLALRKSSVDHGAAGDGAEGYALPMDVGVRVTPLTNLGLPSLAEAVAPVAVLTGDSLAVATRTTRNRMGIPTFERTSYSAYAEAVRANGVERTVQTEPLTLFTVSGSKRGRGSPPPSTRASSSTRARLRPARFRLRRSSPCSVRSRGRRVSAGSRAASTTRRCGGPAASARWAALSRRPSDRLRCSRARRSAPPLAPS